MKNTLYTLLKATARISIPFLPAIENVEETSDNDLQCQGIEKHIIPSKLIHICTRL